jgi:hypothetical protein
MSLLDRALDRLLHKRSYRAALIEGRFDALELAPADLAAVQSIDLDALVRTANLIAERVLARRHTGSGNLIELFPRTLDGWHRAHPRDTQCVELALAFMDSAAFDDYRELPYSGIGQSIEEAFYRFCESAEIGDRLARESEFLAAIMKLFVVSPAAEVRVPDCVQRSAHGLFAVSSRGAPRLYAAVRGRFVAGPLTPFLADLIAPGADMARVAVHHCVPDAVLREAIAKFTALGILGS